MGKKILIIDDDPVFTTLVERLLTKKEYEVLKANRGQEGLRLMFAEKPDLVLLSLHLFIIVAGATTISLSIY